MVETILVPGVGKSTLVTVTTLIETEDVPITDPNDPPVVNAGASQTIQLPVNEVTLNGSANDSDGQIVSYLWEKVSGGAASMANPTLPVTKVTGLGVGEFSFKLTVKDNEGASTFSTTKVTVKEAIVVPPPPTGSYKLTYSNDYDQPSDVNENQLGRGKQVVFSGRGVFMSEVRSGDSAISNGFRSEQQYDNLQASPVEGIWEWEAYYENWNNVKGNGHSFQFHPKSSSGSAVWSLQNYSGKFNVVRSLNGTNFHQSGTLKPVEQNRWYKFKLEAKWSAGNDGYLNFYIDGVLYHSYKGATCASNGVYVKVGQNTWQPVPTKAVVYYDNFNVYTKS
jgi:hypothetical protein